MGRWLMAMLGVWMIACDATDEVQPTTSEVGTQNESSESGAAKGQSTTYETTDTDATGTPSTSSTTDATEGLYDTCLTACESSSDCAMGLEAYDEDNYACVEGGCVYTGCVSDLECQSLGDYVCQNVGLLFVCQPACDVVADCDLGLAPYDEDNYDCVAGGCAYTGCLSDDECGALGAYACAPNVGEIRYCAPSCTEVTDCVQPGDAYDEDNYACEEGACVYTGCHSDKECSPDGDFVCGSPIL